MSGSLAQLIRLGLALAFNPARIAENAADSARRLTVLLVCGLIAGFILLPAIGCGAAGLWIFVQERLGPVWAAFITAGALVLVAVIVLLIGLLASRRPRSRRREREQTSGSSPLDSASAMLPALLGLLAMPKKAASAGAAAGRGFFARHKGTILLGAGIAGLVLGQDLFRPGRKRKG
ncbi:MAG TPA: hypothetical protein VL752_15570 [Acidisoma sp.]|uniref:hypothetical protein n=1 Tax=Acidisoma sp. TaxID=1872115 RepID=UPI002C709824|nr:hypothetical protein [Acidisoma sp.]HTI02368.1 hypothetical protein [Acidisoma sp.]